MRLQLLIATVCFAFLTALAPKPASSFDESVHELISAPHVPQFSAPVTDGGQPLNVTQAIYAYALEVACRAPAPPWAMRTVTEAAMRALGWRGDAASSPWTPPSTSDPRLAWTKGSSAPDRDARNQLRVLRHDEGALLTDADGSPIAIDPLIPQFGAVTGLASQAHAHYALPETYGVGFWKWFRNPVAAGWDLSGLGRIGSEAAQQLAIHVELAKAAQIANAEAAAYLLGGGAHYLQDAASPLHNIQAGHTSLLWYALWGAIRGWQGITTAGVRIQRNLHLAAEALQAAWVLGSGPAETQMAFVAARRRGTAPSISLGKPLTTWVHALANVGASDGIEIYRLMAKIVKPQYRYGLNDVPDTVSPTKGWRDILIDDPDTEILRHLAELLGRSVRRAELLTQTLVARWNGELRRTPPNSDVALGRLKDQVARIQLLPYPKSEKKVLDHGKICTIPPQR